MAWFINLINLEGILIISICTSAFLVLFIFYLVKRDDRTASIYFGLSLFAILYLALDSAFYRCTLVDKVCIFFVSAILGIVGTKWFPFLVQKTINLISKVTTLLIPIKRHLYNKRKVYAISFATFLTVCPICLLVFNELYSFKFLSQHPKLLKMLVDLNVDLDNVTDSYGYGYGAFDEQRFLMRAIIEGNIEIVKMFLHKKDIIQNALHWAVCNGFGDCVRTLLVAGAEIDEEITDAALRCGGKEVFDILVEYGLDAEAFHARRKEKEEAQRKSKRISHFE